MGVLSSCAHMLLASRCGPVQMAAQPLAPWLTAHMERAFAPVAGDWNGKRSCLLLSFDCDFPEDAQALPEIAAELGRHQLRGSFACVGRWVEDYPEAHAAVRDGGHELLNHSYSHPELVNSPRHFTSARSDFNAQKWGELSTAAQRREIQRCQQVVADKLGVVMEGFRVPHFGNADLAPLHGMLNELGLGYSTSMLAPRAPAYGLPLRYGAVLEIPVTTCPHHPFTSFDSWHAFYARGGWHRDNFGDLLRQRTERGITKGLLTNIYLDPKDRERLSFAELFATLASYQSECWMPTYAQFTQWWNAGEQGACEAAAGP
jgi:peptidoglycan-N-acetylglucosamine deacetylase